MAHFVLFRTMMLRMFSTYFRKQKIIKETLSLIIFAFLFSGCNTFSGQLIVYSPLQIQNHHMMKNSVTFVPGTYPATVEYNSIENYVTLQTSASTVKFKNP